MIRFAIKRKLEAQAVDDVCQEQYFNGEQWVLSARSAAQYTYDEAVSRVIVLNVLDPASRYEVIRIDGHGSQAMHTPPSMDDDISNLMAFA